MLKLIISNVAGLISFALTALLSVLVTKLIEKKQQPVWITLTSVLSLALLFFIASDFLRVSIEAEFQKDIVGVWIESYKRGNAQNYAIASIRYDFKTRQIDFHGNAYTPDGERVGEWDSRKVIVAPGEYKIYYFYDGELIKSPPGIKENRPSVTGFGDITFNESEPNIKSGQGAFREIDTNLPPVRFEINRITEEMCKNLIKKKHLEDHHDYKMLIIAYHQKIHLKHPPKTSDLDSKDGAVVKDTNQ